MRIVGVMDVLSSARAVNPASKNTELHAFRSSTSKNGKSQKINLNTAASTKCSKVCPIVSSLIRGVR